MKNLDRLLKKLVLAGMVLWLGAACSPGIKMSERGSDWNPTLTPFLPKAAFTSTNTPIALEDDQEGIDSIWTSTTDPNFTAVSTGEEMNEQATSTADLTPGADETEAVSTATASPVPPSAAATSSATSAPGSTTAPSATPEAAAPSATPEPTAANQPTGTSAPSSTPIPSATSAPSASADPGVCSFSGNSAYENQVVDLINQERQDRGLAALAQNASLRTAARTHSEDMACNDFFSHTGSDGSTMSSRILAAGYSFSWAAENIAASSSCSFSAQSVVNMWMNSSGHRANILSENAVHIGVGFRCASDGTSGDLDAYYTANFGRP